MSADAADPGPTPARARVRDAATGRYATSAGPSSGGDPLAAERTAWLAGVVGGKSALARWLGVSASQTSRWASGIESPGAVSGPLLIDVEHVLARVRLVWGEQAALTWMDSANAHLGGARPIEVLRSEGVGPVLLALDAGTWGSGA